MKKINNHKAGFTLLEILLVVGIISILAGIVILAINPTKQLGDTRNAQRRSDVVTILNAIYQYALDNDGELPLDNASGAIPDGDADDCSTLGSDAYDFTDALVSTTSAYLVDVPIDPIDGVADTSSGYLVVQGATSQRVTVCAPGSIGEGNVSTTTMISVTR